MEKEYKVCPDWCGHEDICSSDKHKELTPSELGMMVTDILLNREPGWSGRLEKTIKSFTSQVYKDAKISGIELGEKSERQRIIEIVKTNKDPYMMPETEKRFLEDIN